MPINLQYPLGNACSNMRYKQMQNATENMLRNFSQKVLGKVFQKKRKHKLCETQPAQNACARRIADKLMHMATTNQEDTP